ncbi:hypothetical protein C5167_009222 [Papaver somniferum]|uniref:Uncharacterized protein n=1 Tax=Papaver somniferum TaxID=3469 RepID=A0A4Y7JZP2_PAPSO|nr:hypothetical protein C5167_009222 [Papaver somniferum]
MDFMDRLRRVELMLEDIDVPHFPRGGGSTLSKQKKTNTTEDNDFGGDIAGKITRYANKIALKHAQAA